MNKETQIWWIQAQADLESATKALSTDSYYSSVFWCQQACEKGLKALYISKKKMSAGTTHSLIFLAKETATPTKFHSQLRELALHYIQTRYPDANIGAPVDSYDKPIAQKYVDFSNEVFAWIATQIK